MSTLKGGSGSFKYRYPLDGWAIVTEQDAPIRPLRDLQPYCQKLIGVNTHVSPKNGRTWGTTAFYEGKKTRTRHSILVISVSKRLSHSRSLLRS